MEKKGIVFFGWKPIAHHDTENDNGNDMMGQPKSIASNITIYITSFT